MTDCCCLGPFKYGFSGSSFCTMSFPVCKLSLLDHFVNGVSGFVCFVLCLKGFIAGISGSGFRHVDYPCYSTSSNLLLPGVKLLLLGVSYLLFNNGFYLSCRCINVTGYTCNLTSKFFNSIDQPISYFFHGILPS